jgi:hypothetical protein
MTLLHHVDDPRNGFQKFRRAQLWHIAEKEGIPFRPGEKAAVLISQLASAGVDPGKYRNLVLRDALNGNQSGRVEVNTPQEPRPVEKPLEEMSVFELRKIAKSKGIPFDNKTKKKELLALLKE